MAVASRPNTTILSIWHRPYSWLTAVAIIITIFDGFIIGGFVPTIRTLIDVYSSSEANRAAVVNIATFLQITIFALPIIITVIGAILLFQKRRVGIYIMLAGLGIYLSLSLSSIPLSGCCNIYVPDPVRWFVGYWHKPIADNWFFDYWYAQKATFYYFFLPSMLVMIALASVGWLKTRRLY